MDEALCIRLGFKGSKGDAASMTGSLSLEASNYVQDSVTPPTGASARDSLALAMVDLGEVVLSTSMAQLGRPAPCLPTKHLPPPPGFTALPTPRHGGSLCRAVRQPAMPAPVAVGTVKGEVSSTSLTQSSLGRCSTAPHIKRSMCRPSIHLNMRITGTTTTTEFLRTRTIPPPAGHL